MVSCSTKVVNSMMIVKVRRYECCMRLGHLRVRVRDSSWALVGYLQHGRNLPCPHDKIKNPTPFSMCQRIRLLRRQLNVGIKDTTTGKGVGTLTTRICLFTCALVCCVMCAVCCLLCAQLIVVAHSSLRYLQSTHPGQTDSDQESRE